jgi:hypothetical protein
MLVAISGSAVVFSVIAGSLYALHRVQRSVEQESHLAADLHQFATRFREDAHAADRFALETSDGDVADNAANAAESTPRGLMLHQGADHIVVYEFNPAVGQLRRRVRHGETTVHRDTYALPRAAEVEWQTPAVDAPAVVTCVISYRTGGESLERQTPRKIRIEAAIGSPDFPLQQP